MSFQFKLFCMSVVFLIIGCNDSHRPSAYRRTSSSMSVATLTINHDRSETTSTQQIDPLTDSNEAAAAANRDAAQAVVATTPIRFHSIYGFGRIIKIRLI